MKNNILTIIWLSWVSFCSVLALLFRLLPVKKSLGNFSLTETVCGHLHSKNILSDKEMEFEHNQAINLDKVTLFGYWILVAPILPILRKSEVINKSVTYFAKRWIKDSENKNVTQKLTLWNSNNIGEMGAKITYLMEHYTMLLRFSPIITLLSVIGINLFVTSPHYLLEMVIGMYFFTLIEFVTIHSNVEIKHSKFEVYICSILLLAAYFILLAKAQTLEWFTVLTMGLSFGVIQGSLGFVLGHEIGHKSGFINKVLSKLMFSLSGYSQFWEVHNNLHHKHIGTSNDSSSSKKGQKLSMFIKEQIKLYKNNLSGYDLIAMMTPFIIAPSSSIFLITTMVTGYFLLETINYIQHYGLERTDRLDEHLSWDTNNLFSNAFLFNLGRHGHHHLSGKKWHHTLEFKSNHSVNEGYFAQTIYAIIL